VFEEKIQSMLKGGLKRRILVLDLLEFQPKKKHLAAEKADNCG
jgi:hypothetical protein